MKNKINSICIFLGLSSTEVNNIQQILNQNHANVLAIYNNFYALDIINKIKMYMVNSTSKSATIYLVANIVKNKKNTFVDNKGNFISIKELTNMLNQQSYNANKQLVKYNRKILFINYQTEKIKTSDDNDDDTTTINVDVENMKTINFQKEFLTWFNKE